MDIPFIDSQDPNLLQYAELDPDAWLEASSKASDAPPPASEREREAGLPTAASSGEESEKDAEIEENRTKTRSGRKINPPTRLGYQDKIINMVILEFFVCRRRLHPVIK